MKLLIAEDSEFTQLIIEQNILSFNIDYTFVSDGQQALDLLEEEEFDLILLDIEMPVLDGFKTIQRIRKQLYLDTPVLAMTAHNSQDFLSRLEIEGFAGHIPKPFSPDVFSDIIKETCGIKI